MAGRAKEDPTKTQQQEIAEKKVEFLRFYEKTGVKQAACDWIGRHKDTVALWEEQDADFSEAVSKAKAAFLASVQRRLKPDNLVANLYQDYKPPKQEIDHNLAGGFAITYVTPDDPTNPDPVRADVQTTPGLDEADRPDND